MRADPSRFLVYKAEDRVRQILGDPQLSAREIEHLFDDLVHSSLVHDTFPDKQFDKLYLKLDGKIPNYRPYTDGFRITLQKDNYTRMYLLHEFAHFLQHNASAHHGKQFCTIYCWLLYHFFSKRHGREMSRELAQNGCI